MMAAPTQTILITGASTGIGLATARYFAQRGWQVVATMRTPHKAPADLHTLANVLVLPLDVLDVASIETAVAATLHTSLTMRAMPWPAPLRLLVPRRCSSSSTRMCTGY
jgi:NAD(P)-dependent dehydrogenase (short-subunit alcohol dehydrogenase family)